MTKNVSRKEKADYILEGLQPDMVNTLEPLASKIAQLFLDEKDENNEILARVNVLIHEAQDKIVHQVSQQFQAKFDEINAMIAEVKDLNEEL